METKHKKLIILLFLVLLCGTGCNKPDHASTTIVPPTDVGANSLIRVTAPEGCNTYLINANVCLMVELISTTPVIIDNHDIKILEFVNGEWVSIEASGDYPPLTYIIYPDDNFLNRSAMLWSRPILEDRTESVSLRFVVSGHLYQNEKPGESISAYIDVTLHP